MADDAYQIMYEAFNRCDQDADGRLKVHEFLRFCDEGLGKPQSDESMYAALCAQLNVEPSVGVSWNDISVMFAASNQGQQEEYAGDASPHGGDRDHYRTSSMSYDGRDSRGLTADALLRHDRAPSTASIDDYGDSMSQTSEPRTHHRSTSLKRDSSMAELAIIEALQGSNDAQQKKLKDMSKNLKHMKKKVNSLTRDKEAATEQISQLNAQLTAMQNTVQRLEQEKSEVKQRLTTERNRFEEKIRLLQNQVDDDRKTITHLEGQHIQAQQERDQVLQLFKNAETQFETQLTTIKRKHKEQLEKVSVGFLQSLGAQPGEDIRQIVKELRDEKRALTQQVGMLAEQLTRKDRSLFEALQAIDILSTQQRMQMRGTGRRPSRSMPAGSGGPAGGDMAGAPTATTPGGDEMSSRFDKQTSPTFFIDAVADGSSSASGISASQSNAHRPVGPEGQVKQYQMVANGLTEQVLEREQEIENLRAANEVLGRQINRQGKS